MPAAQPRGQGVSLCPNPGHAARCVDRWELLSLVTTLRKELGLADRDVMVLRAHLTVLPHGPLNPDGLNVSFMSVSEILQRACGMDERRFRRGEARLEQVGLIRRRLSGNGRRFPERDRTGRIVSAYGVDLAPLLARRADLEAMADMLREQQLILRHRKNSLSARLSAAVRALTATGQSLPAWLDTLRDGLRRIVRRKAPTGPEIDAVEAEINRLEGLISADDGVSEPSSIQPDTQVRPDKAAADDGQSVRHIESRPKERNIVRSPAFDIAGLRNVWCRTKAIREFYPECPRHEREATGVLLDFSRFMKLDTAVVSRALGIMGWEKTVTSLDYLAENLRSIKRPSAYLRTVTDRHHFGRQPERQVAVVQ